jgi:hypothetical protein
MRTWEGVSVDFLGFFWWLLPYLFGITVIGLLYRIAVAVERLSQKD